jgi:S1-C subfamily serine protease
MGYGISVRFSKIIATALVVLLAAQAQAISTAALQQGIPSLAPMLEQVTPAVVSIRVSKAMPTSGRGSEQQGRP